jgi:pyruvate/2-oxoglutarate dehydrogenase complex dihydrolipoamide acyltransferase (E2) component
VDAERLSDFINQCNQKANSLISVAHVLIGAVGRSLARHPQLNCRIIGGRIYRFRDVNVRMICFDRKRSDVDILTITQADRTGLEDIAQFIWNSQLEIAADRNSDRLDKVVLGWGPNWSRRLTSKLFWWLDRHFRLPRLGRIDRHLDSAVVVNYLGFADAPPMRMYKPSKFPDESSLLSVTLGRIEQKPVVYEGQVVARRVAPLFVRADHRVTDAHQLSQFIGTLRNALENPLAAELQIDDARSIQDKAA